MKELADTFRFRVSAAGIEFGKCCFHKTGCGGEVTGQSNVAHSTTVWDKVYFVIKTVDGLCVGKIQVICQVMHVEGKGGIIC